MQLLNKTLRCLQLISTCKFNAKCLLNNYPAAVGSPTCQATHQRHYAAVPPIAMSFEQFDGATTDASRSPLITLHGLFGSKQNWRGVSKALASKTNRRIYTVDLRNHGESPHSDIHNSHGMTADLGAFMQANSLAKSSFMGHSMGGRAVMHFALTYPQLVERLIVVDISPITMPKTLDEMGNIFDAMLGVNIPSTVSLSAGRQQAKKQLLATVGKDSVDFILLNLRKKPDTGEFYWACNVQVLRNSLEGFTHYGANIANLPPFTGPTTFLCGSHSPYMNPNDWPQILKFFPNANIHWLDTGHLVHLEEPHKFIGITSEFLNKP